ncbi:FMN-binding negative transcriptional regulator [Oleomonas cavernae]|uniref:FMN-binding negative transcriptional regulator n=1 Tax=Oleomonas cavernae TaxID=2320859 RepID=A0A418WEK1_9PROT|nr:FMN-binding negative transcriptional regulator [Oleomonas cavernae]RJF88451.1 FMN-binding negative transcriptional regulator [Oleomonas cavernae]
MYQPAHHREDRLAVQHALIGSHPLGLLVTAGPGGLMANPIPFLVDPGRSPLGTLRAHCARANPQWRELDKVDECLVAFQGPQAYVSPSWYATKAETGKVVPTWNYITVQVRGRPRLVDDPVWLRQQIGDLTRSQETGRPDPWAVEDAPAEYLATMIRGIVGMEIPIARIEGKWKVSQNRTAEDRAGVAAGLRADDAAAAMADLVAAWRGAAD